MQNKIEYKLLADCPDTIPTLTELWFTELGQPWVPGADIARAHTTYQNHLNHDSLPLTVVARHEDQAIGMASLRANDGIRDDLSPWLGSLVVDPGYRRQGIGQALITRIMTLAQAMGYAHLYLFALDPTLPAWYNKLGWREIAQDQFRQRPVTVMMRSLIAD